jgi:hypothetical protein
MEFRWMQPLIELNNYCTPHNNTHIKGCRSPCDLYCPHKHITVRPAFQDKYNLFFTSLWGYREVKVKNEVDTNSFSRFVGYHELEPWVSGLLRGLATNRNRSKCLVTSKGKVMERSILKQNIRCITIIFETCWIPWTRTTGQPQTGIHKTGQADRRKNDNSHIRDNIIPHDIQWGGVLKIEYVWCRQFE